METSIIIRVKNEKHNLEKLFEILKSQTYQDFEIIIVNNKSTDRSDRVALEYFPKDRIQIVNISEFSYPKACNLGAEKASGEFLVFLSAHSYPRSKIWLSDGLRNFNDEKVAGVYAFPSYPITGSESSIWEKLFYGIPGRITRKKSGELQNTNSIIRKNLWKKHNFDESLIINEDLEWSIFWKRKGYKITNDPKFTVIHSHNLSLREMIKQSNDWHRANKEINKNLEY